MLIRINNEIHTYLSLSYKKVSQETSNTGHKKNPKKLTNQPIQPNQLTKITKESEAQTTQPNPSVKTTKDHNTVWWQSQLLRGRGRMIAGYLKMPELGKGEIQK